MWKGFLFIYFNLFFLKLLQTQEKHNNVFNYVNKPESNEMDLGGLMG